MSNHTDDVLVGVQIRHRGETSKPVSIALKGSVKIQMAWDDHDPYELFVSHGGGTVVIGQCRAKRVWRSDGGLIIWVASVVPPKLECYEEG